MTGMSVAWHACDATRATHRCVNLVQVRETRGGGCVALDAARPVHALLTTRRMAKPRIRDFLTFLTTLPASFVILVCLFLPHTSDCHHHARTPFETGTWLAILPIALFGLCPLVWRLSASARRMLPEIALMFTLIVMALFVVTIPVAIILMWGYSKRSYRGEALVAMCGAACAMMFLFVYPFLTLFEDWLPAAVVTWGAAGCVLVGLIVWMTAAIARPALVEPRPHKTPLDAILPDAFTLD